MEEDLIWNIGQEAAGQGSLENATPKAYFYWKVNGRVVRSNEFTRPELEGEIERLRSLGEDTTQYSLALKSLNNQTGSR